jgi:hypothetical protein
LISHARLAFIAGEGTLPSSSASKGLRPRLDRQLAVTANQAAQVSLVSGDAAAREDSVLSVDVDNVDAALARATGLLPDYDKCQAYIADVHGAFRSGS